MFDQPHSSLPDTKQWALCLQLYIYREQICACYHVYLSVLSSVLTTHVAHTRLDNAPVGFWSQHSRQGPQCGSMHGMQANHHNLCGACAAFVEGHPRAPCMTGHASSVDASSEFSRTHTLTTM